MELINEDNVKADVVVSRELIDHSIEASVMPNITIKQFLYNVQKYYLNDNQVKMLIASNKPTTTHCDVDQFAQYYSDYDVKLLFVNGQWKLISTKYFDK